MINQIDADRKGWIQIISLNIKKTEPLTPPSQIDSIESTSPLIAVT